MINLTDINELALAQKYLKKYDDMGWNRDRSNDDYYLHFEDSKLIDALREKKDLVDKSKDIIFVVFPIFTNYEISFNDIVNNFKQIIILLILRLLKFLY